MLTSLGRFRGCLLIASCMALGGFSRVREARAEEVAPAPTPQDGQRRMKAGFEGGQSAVSVLKAARASPPLTKMTEAEKVEYAAYQKWLDGLIERIEARLAPMAALQTSVDKARTITPTDAKKMNALTADLFATMRTIEAEATQKTTSPQLKSRHDTVKNSVSNVR